MPIPGILVRPRMAMPTAVSWPAILAASLPYDLTLSATPCGRLSTMLLAVLATLLPVVSMPLPSVLRPLTSPLMYELSNGFSAD